jgi:hypothetical protein
MAVKIDGTLGIDTVKSSALTDKLGRRNYLINGNFDKWDYAISQTSSGYGSDNRWMNGNSGSSKTCSQQVCGNTERALFNAMYFSRTVVSSSSGSGNFVDKVQPIENVNLLAGKTITLSFWAKADTNKNIAVEFWQSFGTGGSPSGSVGGIGSQLVALTTTWQKKTITLTIPSIVGKTLGTDGAQTTSTGLVFWFDAGSTFASRSANLGQQSGTFDIAQVKIEDGSVATNGWHPYDGEFGGEVHACARYLPVILGQGVLSTSGTIPNIVTNRNLYFSLQVLPRVPVTGITISSVSHFNVTDLQLFDEVITSLAFMSSSYSVVSLLCVSPVSSIVGRFSVLSGNNANAKILFTGCEL